VDLLHARERNTRQAFRAEHRRAERRKPDERDRSRAEAREPRDPRPSSVVRRKHVLLPRRGQPAGENRMPLLQGRHRLRDPPRKDDGFAAGFLRHALPDLQDLYEPDPTALRYHGVREARPSLSAHRQQPGLLESRSVTPRRHPRLAARWLLGYLEEDPETTMDEAAMVAACLATPHWHLRFEPAGRKRISSFLLDLSPTARRNGTTACASLFRGTNAQKSGRPPTETTDSEQSDSARWREVTAGDISP
jgi:hypothetical protein